MGRQSKTIRNKHKIKVEDYKNNYVDNKTAGKKVTNCYGCCNAF